MPEQGSMAFTLSLDNVSCERDDRVLFSGLSATFSSGDLVQVLGPNGAGKTTLLKIITGVSSRYSGNITWQGLRVPSFDFTAALLYLGHATGVNTSLTPLENMRWFFGLHGFKSVGHSRVSDAAMLSALAQVGLAGYEEVPCHHMSAGQQRRVALARLYVSESPLWVLDEPFTAIDTQGVAALEQRFEDHRARGGIVVLTTHQSLPSVQPTVIDLAQYVEVAR